MSAPKVPSKVTLSKYGLTAAEWLAIYDAQGGVCAVCGKLPSTGRLNVDHAHVKGWKKLPADERKWFVRGLCCYVCNHRILTRGVTVERLRGAVAYLERYRVRIEGAPANDNGIPELLSTPASQSSPS